MTKPDENAGDGIPDEDNKPNGKQVVDVTVNQNRGDSGSVSTGGWEFLSRDAPLAEKERWFKTYWRPASAWLYLFINLFDFVIAPVITMILPKIIGSTYVPWTPLTLTSGGMFHLAFGGIIGVTAWGRTRERINGVGPADNG